MTDTHKSIRKDLTLLIEDNPAHAELVIRSFENSRVRNEIVQFSTGEEALDFLYNRGSFSDRGLYQLPKLVLLDLNLPKKSGFEILSEIKSSKQLREIPVVVLTTSNRETDAAKAYSCYANSYLVKPTDFDSFRQLINDVSNYWLSCNRTPAN